MTLRTAAAAVLARWDSPQWEWSKHGPTADLMHTLRAALAQPAAPAQPVAWQPIETAPKSKHRSDGRIEGVYFLAYCPDKDATDLESCVCVCWWEPLMNRGRGQWYGEGMYPLHPTHWMPLPPAPGAAQAAQPAPQPLTEARLIVMGPKNWAAADCIEFGRAIERAHGITAAPTTDKGQG